jgi:hypothetical protein
MAVFAETNVLLAILERNLAEADRILADFNGFELSGFQNAITILGKESFGRTFASG